MKEIIDLAVPWILEMHEVLRQEQPISSVTGSGVLENHRIDLPT